ncbi:MAG: flagellar protein export ATPase FliI [Alphaproteobacteria bacterium]|nr:flagellar protein export ATPase FliI [Alphaproteobacteria bacterium]
MNSLDPYLQEIDRIQPVHVYGNVAAVMGLLVEAKGIDNAVSIGSRCVVEGRGGLQVPCEVVGFKQDRTLLMPFTGVEGIGLGNKIRVADEDSVIRPDASWKGRILNAFAQPVDENGPLKQGQLGYPLRAKAPSAHKRKRVGSKIDLGVRALNTFVTCCRGQRMGIFSGSGVGKSILLSMIARYSTADVNVIGLVGERGRELKEFIEDDLGPEGLARSVVVVATSDESALMRKQAAYVTLSVAEYFRDQGAQVLCLMDSVTRFAMAQREIGLSAGEPPTSKGYTPTVFAELPKLLERAGPSEGEGTITGLFSVLVEGDDHNEPISDAVRGILDGHIVLDRAIAQRGRYPSVNILRSVSRTMPQCNTAKENAIVQQARNLLSTYDDMAEMIRLGAYRKGADANVDEAIRLNPALEAFLAQREEEKSDLEMGYHQLASILGVRDWKP